MRGRIPREGMRVYQYMMILPIFCILRPLVILILPILYGLHNALYNDNAGPELYNAR